MTDPDPNGVRIATPILLLIGGLLYGAIVGAMTNAINDLVCSDYFAIVMSWDGEHPLWRAMLQGVIEGGALGAFFGLFIAIALIVCSIFLHRRWMRIVRRASAAFPVVPIAPVQSPPHL